MTPPSFIVIVDCFDKNSIDHSKITDALFKYGAIMYNIKEPYTYRVEVTSEKAFEEIKELFKNKASVRLEK